MNIDKMSLAECIAYLREMIWLDVNRGNHIEVIDRIYELTRWIPVEERMPTKEDADEHEEVLGFSPDPHITVQATMTPMSELFTHWRRMNAPEDK